LYPKCAKTRLRASVISKIFPGVIPRTPVIKGREGDRTRKGERRGREREGGEEERGGKGEERKRGKGGGMGNLAPYLFRKVGAYGYYLQ
jgi:hypothetical protein